MSSQPQTAVSPDGVVVVSSVAVGPNSMVKFVWSACTATGAPLSGAASVR